VYFSSPAAPVRPITIIAVTNPPALDNAWLGFQNGMQAFGYISEVNIRYIEVPSTADIAVMTEHLNSLMSPDVDLVYVMGVLAARAVKEVTKGEWRDVPVVFGVVSNPVGGGFIESMQSSGNNFVGITPANETVSAKRLEVFLRAVPETRRIVFPWSDETTSGVIRLREAAQNFGVELVEQKVANREELLAFLDSFSFEVGDALLRSSDSVSASALDHMISLAEQRKIPLMGTNSLDAERGALLSYGANYYKIGEQAARLTHAIVQGAKPTELPNELPEEFEFFINADTAEAIGVSIPNEAFLEANRVIHK
jgi:putative ABC transport system substrate-binding protein